MRGRPLDWLRARGRLRASQVMSFKGAIGPEVPAADAAVQTQQIKSSIVLSLYLFLILIMCDMRCRQYIAQCADWRPPDSSVTGLA